MKYPLFSESERYHIRNHYNNKLINPKTFLIERYEMAKAISNFKKEIKRSYISKTIYRLLDLVLY